MADNTDRVLNEGLDSQDKSHSITEAALQAVSLDASGEEKMKTPSDSSDIAVHGSVLSGSVGDGEEDQGGKSPHAEEGVQPGQDRKIKPHWVEQRIGSRNPDFRRYPYNNRVIAIDFDNVLCRKVEDFIEERKKIYGKDTTLEDIHQYIWFENKGKHWGSLEEVKARLAKMDQLLPGTFPIAGLHTFLMALHTRGHQIHLITSRTESHRDAVINWLKGHYLSVGLHHESVIKGIWFTGDYERQERGFAGVLASDNENLKSALMEQAGFWGMSRPQIGFGKLKALRAIGASLYITDYQAKLEPILCSPPFIPCLLIRPPPAERAAELPKSGILFNSLAYEEERKQFEKYAKPDDPDDFDNGFIRGLRLSGVNSWVSRWDQAAAIKAKKKSAA